MMLYLIWNKFFLHQFVHMQKYNNYTPNLIKTYFGRGLYDFLADTLVYVLLTGVFACDVIEHEIFFLIWSLYNKFVILVGRCIDALPKITNMRGLLYLRLKSDNDLNLLLAVYFTGVHFKEY